MSKFILLSLIVLVFSACSLQKPVSDTTSEYLPVTPAVEQSDDSLNTIEADLESTLILDEDFDDEL
jgi:hypothetical protein